MDIFSHGLWGAVAFAKKGKKSFWPAFIFGILPDLSAFGPVFINHLFTNGFVRPDFATYEPPRPDLLPSYVNGIYNFSHSFFIFLFVFLIVWILRKKPFWELSAWGIHIIIDIPTHTLAFFPTPFLYPFFSYKISGILWMNPFFFITNLTLLVAIYAFFYFYVWREKTKK